MAELIVHEFSNEGIWLDALVDAFFARVKMQRDGPFSVALSGGTSPGPFYHALGERTDLPWNQIVWCLGDERCVPLDSFDRNERMVRDCLGERLSLDAFLSWGDVLDPEEAAARMALQLAENVGQPPIFDLVLLGLGPDGHTASLFPGTSVLDVYETCAAAVYVPHLKSWRLTLTLPTFNQAREVWFVIRGCSKADVVRRLVERDPELVAAKVEAGIQRVFWLH